MSDKARVPPFSDPAFAKKAGSKGGRATADKYRKRGLSLEQLGELETIDDAKRWLALIGQHVLSGGLNRQDGDVGIRAVRAWLEAHGSSIASEALEELRGQVKDLRQIIGPRRSA